MLPEQATQLMLWWASPAHRSHTPGHARKNIVYQSAGNNLVPPLIRAPSLEGASLSGMIAANDSNQDRVGESLASADSIA